MTSISDDGSCSKVFEVDSEATIWKTCDFSLDVLSPEGSRIIGLPAYQDGLGPTTIAMLDAASGEPVAQWSGGDRATVMGQVWEDEDHLLVIVFQGNQWGIVRLGSDGSMEHAVEPVSGDDTAAPFRLVSR